MLRASSLVGRDSARSLLTALLERARAGDGGVVALVGPAGMGKSAVLRHSVGSARDVVSGRCTPPPASAFRPLAELAAALTARGARADDQRLRLHRRALNVLLAGVADKDAEPEAPTPASVADGLIHLAEVTPAARRPSLLVIEDLHWADDLTLAAVEYLADQVRARPMAVILTLRPDGQANALARRLHARHSADLAELGPLPEQAVRDLLSDCLGGDPPDGLERAVAIADGVPLLVEELVAAYELRAELCSTGAGWRFEPSGAAIPASVTESAAIRLAGLEPAERRVLDCAALLGRDFDVTLLPAALGVSAATVDAALRAGLDSGLLAPEPAAARLRFAHALIRDAVLASAGGAERRDISCRVLAALAGRLEAGTDLDLGASLAVSAGQPEAAAVLLERAGARDLALGLPSAAADRFDQALGLRRDGIAALPAREGLLQALAMAGDSARALAEGQVVQRQLRAAGADHGRLARCTVAMARAAASAGRWPEAGQTLRLLGFDHQEPPAIAALGALVALELGQLDRSRELALRAFELGSADPAAACEAAEVLGRLARRSDLDEALQWFETAAATAELHGLSLWRARGLHEMATVDQLRTVSVDGLLRAREAAIAASAPGLLAAVEFHIAAVRGVRFETDEALDAGRRCLATARRLGAVHQEAWAWNLIGQAHAAAGDRARAQAAASEATALAPGDLEIAAIAVGTCRGLASLLADDLDHTLAEAAEAIGLLRQLPNRGPLPPWYLWPLLATVFDLEGDQGAAARAETDTAEIRVATGADGMWHLADAVARGRSGDLAGAQAAAAAAAARFALAPPLAGYVHLGYRIAARDAIRDGWGDPARWMPDASAWAGQRGHRGLAQACAALARQAGVPARRRGRGKGPVPPHLDRLGVTSREVDVLTLVCEGLTNREIAQRLYLSPGTVKGYVESLLAKTGSANRTQLASAADPPAAGR